MRLVTSRHQRRAREIQAATAEPTTPATSRPMAAMSGFTLPLALACFDTKSGTTRAAMGTPETPAAPMQGLVQLASER